MAERTGTGTREDPIIIEIDPEHERAREKRSFVRDFLLFAGHAATETRGGSGRKVRRKLESWQSEKATGRLKLPNDQSETKRLRVHAHSKGLFKKAFGIEPIASGVFAAEVKIGNQRDDWDQIMEDVATVLHVTEEPPAVYYDVDGTGLRAVDPGTEQWDQLTEFVDTVVHSTVLGVSNLQDYLRENERQLPRQSF